MFGNCNELSTLLLSVDVRSCPSHFVFPAAEGAVVSCMQRMIRRRQLFVLPTSSHPGVCRGWLCGREGACEAVHTTRRRDTRGAAAPGDGNAWLGLAAAHKAAGGRVLGYTCVPHTKWIVVEASPPPSSSFFFFP